MTQKHTAKQTQEFVKAKKGNILKWPNQSADLNPIKHLTIEDFGQKDPQTHSKAAAVKTWQSIRKRKPAHVPEFKTPGCHSQQRVLNQVLEIQGSQSF